MTAKNIDLLRVGGASDAHPWGKKKLLCSNSFDPGYDHTAGRRLNTLHHETRNAGTRGTAMLATVS